MIRPWPRLASRRVFDAGLFRVTRDRTRSPRTGQARDVYVLHMADWLLVVALTTQGRLVMVRQFRHGSREAGLELPGGLADWADEPPGQGAARELVEETGYGGGTWSPLGSLRPQPALLSNRLLVFLARDVRSTAVPEPDAGEDIEVILVDPAELPACVASGEINNATTVAALALARFGGHF